MRNRTKSRRNRTTLRNAKLNLEYLEDRVVLSANFGQLGASSDDACPFAIVRLDGERDLELPTTTGDCHYGESQDVHGRASRDYVAFPESWQGGLYDGVQEDLIQPLTVILDFNEFGQGNTTDGIGNIVSIFNIPSFGFNSSAADFELIANSVLAKVQTHYHDIQWGGFPAGEQLTVEFEIGDIGTPPQNGSSDYYYLQIGTDQTLTGLLGQASLNSIRDPFGVPGAAVGSVIGSVFSDAIQGLGGLSPSDALSSGNLEFTTNALAGTISHEIGHGLSLLHIDKAGTTTPTGLPPIMGTGAIDLPNQDRVDDRDFSIQGNNAQAGGQIQKHLDQLDGAVSLHDATMPYNLATADQGFAYMFPATSGDRVDDTMTGDFAIEFLGDVDSVFYAPQTTGVHTITLDTTTSVEPYLSLYDAETGAKLVTSKPEGTGQDTQLSVQLNQWQRYVIAGADFKSETTGDVILSVTGPGTTTQTTLSFDANLEAMDMGTLQAAGDVDAYRIVVPAGVVGIMDVVVQPSSGLDAVVVLWDPAGNEIQRSDNGPPGWAESISVGGAVPGEEYIVTVLSEDYASSGNFDITVSFANSALPNTLTTASQGYAYAFPAATGDIVDNTTELSMFIGFGSDVDGVYFTPQNSGDHTIRVSNTNGSGVDPIVALYHPSGLRLGVDNNSGPDNDAELELFLLAGQRYIIAAADVGADNAGSISLTVESTDTMPVQDLFVDANGGGAASMFVSQGDVDAFRFVAPNNAFGDLDVTINPGSGLDAVAVLWDANGNVLDRSDLFGLNVNEELSISGVVPGTEYIVTVFANDYVGSDGASISIDFDIANSMEFIVHLAADEDDGDYSTNDLSLREAVRLANENPGPDTITISDQVGGTLGTPLGELVVTGPVTVRGPGAAQLLVSGLGTNRIWNIDDGNDAFDSLVVFEDFGLIDGAADSGGAIQTREPITFRNMEFLNNSAVNSGGAVNATGEVIVENSLFEMNSAGLGGAIRSGGVTISGSTFRNNAADFGGALRLEVGNHTVSDSVLHGNTTNNHGGAIDNAAGNLAIYNSTISENSADWGGGAVWSHGGSHTLTIEHSTLVFNQSDTDQSGFGSGGAILMDNGRTATLSNSIVAGNIDNTGTAPDIWFRASISHSFIGNNKGAILTDVTGNQIGTAAAPLDPMLGPLSDNGGPTDSHLPIFGSPVIDAGDPAAIAGSGGVPTFDQRGDGFSRTTDGDGDGTTRIDIGATEAIDLPILPMMVDELLDESDGDLSVGDLSLREAVEIANQLPGPQTIGFAGGLLNQTIFMFLGEIVVSDAIQIVGPSGGTITLDALGLSRIFYVDDGDAGEESPVTIERITMRNGSTAGSGGAIETFEPLTVRDSVLANNNAGNSGGAIISHGSANQLLVESSTFQQNHADLGGAIRMTDGSIVGSLFLGNTADYGGALRINGTVSIFESALVGNSTNNHGGAIDNAAGIVTIENSTVSGNSANWGGGAVWTHGGQHEFIARHSTIVNNESDANMSGFGSGGAILVDNGRIATLDHTIVAGNVDNTGVAPDIWLGIDATFSLIGNSKGTNLTDGGGNIIGTDASPVDPLLESLGDNGGPTLTHRLMTGSPARDAGDTATALSYDQRGMGYDRLVGSRVDMGSYELQQVQPGCNFDGDLDCDVDDLDDLVSGILAGLNDPMYDLTQDGLVDVDDRDEWLAVAGAMNLASGNSYLLGDANLDGTVDGQDFLAWNAAKFTSGGLWSGGDFNVDGVTDGQDFLIWNGNKFESADRDDGRQDVLKIDLVDLLFAELSMST